MPQMWQMTAVCVFIVCMSLTVPEVQCLNCYICSYTLTAEGDIGPTCRDDPPATGKLYTCPTDDDTCSLRVTKINGHLTELNRYCSINCDRSQPCMDEDYQTDFDQMADGTCYRCCEDHECNGRWEDIASSPSAVKITTLSALALVFLLS